MNELVLVLQKKNTNKKKKNVRIDRASRPGVFCATGLCCDLRYAADHSCSAGFAVWFFSINSHQKIWGRFPLWQKQDVKRNCALTIKTHQENFADVGRFLNISGEIRKSWGLNVHSNGASKFCEQVIMSDKALSTHLK